MAAELCPECRAGKHHNCTRESWDDGRDRLVVCPCSNPICVPTERIPDTLLGVAYPEE